LRIGIKKLGWLEIFYNFAVNLSCKLKKKMDIKRVAIDAVNETIVMTVVHGL
jgi:hypothetical protein